MNLDSIDEDMIEELMAASKKGYIIIAPNAEKIFVVPAPDNRTDSPPRRQQPSEDNQAREQDQNSYASPIGFERLDLPPLLPPYPMTYPTQGYETMDVDPYAFPTSSLPSFHTPPTQQPCPFPAREGNPFVFPTPHVPYIPPQQESACEGDLSLIADHLSYCARPPAQTPPPPNSPPPQQPVTFPIRVCGAKETDPYLVLTPGGCTLVKRLAEDHYLIIDSPKPTPPRTPSPIIIDDDDVKSEPRSPDLDEPSSLVLDAPSSPISGIQGPPSSPASSVVGPSSSPVDSVMEVPDTPSSPVMSAPVNDIPDTPSSPDMCAPVNDIPDTPSSPVISTPVNDIPDTPSSPDMCAPVNDIPETPSSPVMSTPVNDIPDTPSSPVMSTPGSPANLRSSSRSTRTSSTSSSELSEMSSDASN